MVRQITPSVTTNPCYLLLLHWWNIHNQEEKSGGNEAVERLWSLRGLFPLSTFANDFHFPKQPSIITLCVHTTSSSSTTPLEPITLLLYSITGCDDLSFYPPDFHPQKEIQNPYLGGATRYKFRFSSHGGVSLFSSSAWLFTDLSHSPQVSSSHFYLLFFVKTEEFESILKSLYGISWIGWPNFGTENEKTESFRL